MKSTNWGVSQYKKSAEQDLVFLEKFRNQVEVEMNGGTDYGSVVENGVATFDGVDDYIDYGRPQQLQLKEFTVMFWINTNSIANEVVYEYCSNNGFSIQVRSGVSGVLVGSLFMNINNIAKPSTEVISGTGWRHFAVTVKDEINGIKFYVDGIAAGTDAYTMPNYSSGNLYIGGRATHGNFNGQLKNVRMFKAALTAEEILAYANNTMWNYDRNCVMWMDGKLKHYDPTNAQHIDASGKGNNLDFGDKTTASTFPTKLITQGGGYGFDGGDYMTSNDVVDMLNSSDEISVFFISKYIGASTPSFIALYDYGVNERVWSCRSDGLGELQVYVSQDGTLGVNHKQYKTLAVNAFDGVYRFMGFTFTVDTLRLYVDGRESPLNKVVDGTVNTLHNPTMTPLTIGCILNSGVPINQSTEPLLKAVVYKKMLNPTQIRDLHIRMSQDQEV